MGLARGVQQQSGASHCFIPKSIKSKQREKKASARFKFSIQLLLCFFVVLFCFFSLYLRLERNTGREQSLKSLADVLLPLCPADVFSSAGLGH